MNNLENILNEKIKYLYEMLEKYSNLNQDTKGTYRWRENSIKNQIEVLEDLKENKDIRCWDECYKEDLEEYKEK